MTEKQILKKIDAWDENDNIQAIIDFIENLPVEERSTAVLSELGRAYNNFYWLDQSAENEKYLQKAIDVFKYLEEELGETASWNYRIGYSYFYLNNSELAKKHFLRERELQGSGNDVDTYLACIEYAQEKGVSPVEVYNGGREGVQYPLGRFLHFLEKKAPNLRTLIASGVSDAELESFENQIGAKLPEAYKELYRTFNGQKQIVPFFATGNQHFVSLSEVTEIQERWLSFVKQHYGENWKNVRLSEEIFFDEEDVQNTLFNEKWIPILAGEQFFICMDLDPKQEEFYGQIICVMLNEDINNFEVGYLYNDIKDWLGYIIRNLQSEQLVYNAENNWLEFAEDGNYQEAAYYTEEERTALESYIETTFGKFDEVLHELVSPDIHCDIYLIKPTPERNYYTLVTGGMGAFQMYTPEDYHASPFAELVINLPPTWNIQSEEEKDYWPIRWLKNLARLPIQHQTYLGYGHTIPTNDALEGTNFDCLMLIGAVAQSEDGEQSQWAVAELPSGKEVGFFYVVPLYPEETQFKLDQSADDLLDKFEAADIPYPPVVDINRVNVCEDYEAMETPNLLDNIAWAFNDRFYGSLMHFWDAIRDYNADIENDLEDFTPFATIFSSSRVMMMYEAYIKSEKDILENERLLNPETFDNPDEDGMYYARILAELESEDRNYYGALNLLRHIHNTLFNKDLGDHIFFEGFDLESYQEDGTPVIYLNLGS
ncbi:suppressor of fused domain protein [Capnocytophaga cynodegmi]|uniref:suppressor of fused domain protein n=1 Tax=Capnocytophaga cynodegmi TaxID=28189 RepID=UPI00385DEAE2